MTKLTQQDFEKMYAVLSKPLHDLVFSDELLKRAYKIAETYEFDEDEIFIFLDMLDLLVAGARNKVQFKESLIGELFCDAIEANKIMSDVEKDILSVGQIVQIQPPPSGASKWREFVTKDLGAGK